MSNELRAYNPNTPRRFHGPHPAHRTLTFSSVILRGLCGRKIFTTERTEEHRKNRHVHQRETIQALIKIYVRLVIAQSIQLSNIVLVNLR
jgi:hypothetical protein